MEFLSILTLTNYDDDLWNNLNLPTVDITENGVTTTYSIDPDILIPEIIMECSDLALIYPAADYMEGMIGLWSKANYDVWRRLLYTCVVPYNPIWNVDADIKETNSGSNSGRTDSGTTESVKGYNSNTWADHTKDEFGSGSSGSWSESKSMTRQGNIGVTATQDLIDKERNVSQFNIYKYIVDSFKRRFCIMVY